MANTFELNGNGAERAIKAAQDALREAYIAAHAAIEPAKVKSEGEAFGHLVNSSAIVNHAYFDLWIAIAYSALVVAREVQDSMKDSSRSILGLATYTNNAWLQLASGSARTGQQTLATMLALQVEMSGSLLPLLRS